MRGVAQVGSCNGSKAQAQSELTVIWAKLMGEVAFGVRPPPLGVCLCARAKLKGETAFGMGVFVCVFEGGPSFV